MNKSFILDESFGKFAGIRVNEMIPEATIKARVRELAQEISNDYRERVPIIIGVLNGSVIFLSDLFREMSIDTEIDFIKISSYENETKSSGTVRLVKDISCNITGRDVLIVEDIIDSGLTARFLKRRLEESGTTSVKFASFLIKEHTKTEFPIDYVGFKIPDKFVVGYGLDLAQKMRNLKSLYALQIENQES